MAYLHTLHSRDKNCGFTPSVPLTLSLLTSYHKHESPCMQHLEVKGVLRRRQSMTNLVDSFIRQIRNSVLCVAAEGEVQCQNCLRVLPTRFY